MVEKQTSDPTAVPAISCEAINKSYAGVRVLSDFACRIEPGHVLALLGENGSGKSTFIKVLAGVISPDSDSGKITIGGEELAFGTPHSSFDLGCRFVHQDLGLVVDLSVEDNMLLVAGFRTRLGAIRRRVNRASVRADLQRVGLDVDPRAMVRDLSPAQRTGVAVARALHTEEGMPMPRVLVLDEPTATLPDDEVQRLMETVRTAQGAGIGIIYVTHRLDEVFELDGTVTVLRDGVRVADQPARELDKRAVVELMAGERLSKELAATSRRTPTLGEDVLVVRGAQGASVQHADLTVRAGEIVGVAGITGSGREALLPLLFGGLRRESGEVRVNGRAVRPGRTGAAVAAGLGYLPPDRKVAGFADLSVTDNATMADLDTFASPFRIRRKAERKVAEEWTARMAVRPAHATGLLLSNLSGGNQQKVLFAKWLRLGLAAFLLDDPTQGVDVNAKALLHQQLVAAADEGLATVVASTDYDELASLCDRVLIFRKGRIAEELTGSDVTVRAITHACVESEKKVLT